MKKIVVCVRDGKETARLPLTEAEDGTLWGNNGVGDTPLLNSTAAGAPEKEELARLVRSRAWASIPYACFARMGDNEGGLRVILASDWDAERDRDPAVIASRSAAKDLEENTGRVYLSSRGWGDYSSCEWVGDLRRPDADILAECRAILALATDVDKNPADEEIIKEIKSVREKIATRPAKGKERAENERKLQSSGLCAHCGTWCYGDCGGEGESVAEIDARQAHEEAAMDEGGAE